MEVDLSRGAVAAISASKDGAHAADRPPVLQVADLRLICPPGRCPAQFMVALSDGVQSYGVQSVQGILPASLILIVRDGALCRGTVLRLLEYACNTFQNSRIFMFTQFEVLQTDCSLIENGGIELSSTASRPTKNLTYAEYRDESHFSCQGIEADPVRKTVAQINTENLVCSEQEFVVVKATPTFINKENVCYAECPLVVNGKQCRMEVSSSGDGWSHCHSCNQTFVTCDYRYRILFQLQDSTGTTYAPASKQAGEDIFGLTAKELYLMKCEQQDCAQFDNIIEGVLFRDFLFKLKLKTGAIQDKKFPKCTIVKAEKVNPSTESRRLLREINKLTESAISTKVRRTSVGSRIGFSYTMEARQKKQKFSRDQYAMNHGGEWDLVSQTGSNSL